MKNYQFASEWYANLPIRNKLLFWFVPLLVAMISSTGYYTYTTAADEIVAKISFEQAGLAKQAVDHLNSIVQDAVDISDYVFLTPEIQALLANSDNKAYITNRNVVDSINRLMVTRPYFQFLTIYSSHFPTIQFNNKGLSSAIPFDEFQEKFHYDEMLTNPIIENWRVEVPNRGPVIFHGDAMNKLLLTKVLKNYTNMHAEGVLILGIDEKDIRTSYAPELGAAEIIVFRDDGTVLSDSQGKWVGQTIDELPYFDSPIKQPSGINTTLSSQWLFAHDQSSLTGWHVLVLQPRATILQQLNRIKWITCVLVGLAFILSLIVSWSVAGVITRPMMRILASMKKFQKGDFDQHVPLSGRDEIGQLSSGYNTMVKRIKELIHDVYAFELRQNQAELKILQSQINPHFLYNTLNTIAWSAEKNKDTQVAEMIYSLSNIFKISLSEGNDIISLEKELLLAENYLFLQKMRFPDKLNYEFDVAPELKLFKIPKLLIQPLVENAVVHGIEPLTGDVGHIHIGAFLSIETGFVEIEIMDNGVGIAETDYSRLLQQIASQSHSLHTGESFALMNIIYRLRLFYGESAHLDIQTKVGSGTRIKLTLPYTKE